MSYNSRERITIPRPQPLPPVPPKKKDDTWIIRLALLFIFICLVLAFMK